MPDDFGDLEAFLCEHPNEVPGRCPCPPNCYCKGRSCNPVEQAAPEPRSCWDRLLDEE